MLLLTMVILGVGWDSENKKTVNFYFMHSVFLNWYSKSVLPF